MVAAQSACSSAGSIQARNSIHVELSATKTTDASIVLVKVAAPPHATVDGDFGGIQLPFFWTGKSYESVLGVPYLYKPGPAKIVIHVNGQALDVPIEIVEGQYPSEKLHVNPRRVNPSKKDLKRIKREQKLVAAIYTHLTEKKYWSGPFELPLKSVITDPFGVKRMFNGELKSAHTGLDFRAKVGTPIYSAASGVVVLAKNLFYTGNTVMIDHGYGVITLYAHLSKLKVKKGQIVKAHQLVGLSGKTGRVNGPHLHWQAVIHKVKVNPMELTRVME